MPAGVLVHLLLQSFMPLQEPAADFPKQVEKNSSPNSILPELFSTASVDLAGSGASSGDEWLQRSR